jgi:hypothetical protein
MMYIQTIPCEADLSPTSASAFDRAMRAWRKKRQEADLAANEGRAAFTLLAGAPGEQMRSLHLVDERATSRALERIIIAPYGGAPGPCRVCPATEPLSANHLELCGGQPFLAAVRISDWDVACRALRFALACCRRNPNPPVPPAAASPGLRRSILNRESIVPYILLIWVPLRCPWVCPTPESSGDGKYNKKLKLSIDLL